MFRIHALPPDTAALAESATARRVVVDATPGFPCRVSLADAEIGETVTLLNHVSVPETSPFHARHAIFVRDGVRPARPGPGTVPAALAGRVLSLRAFDRDWMLVDAAIAPGADLGRALEAMFARSTAAEIHIHHAAQGCYAARATRAALT